MTLHNLILNQQNFLIQQINLQLFRRHRLIQLFFHHLQQILNHRILFILTLRFILLNLFNFISYIVHFDLQFRHLYMLYRKTKPFRRWLPFILNRCKHIFRRFLIIIYQTVITLFFVTELRPRQKRSTTVWKSTFFIINIFQFII